MKESTRSNNASSPVLALGSALLAAAWIAGLPERIVPGHLQAQEAAPRTDLLTFAEGAVPVGVGGPGAALGANTEHQVRMIDGDPTGFGFIATDDADVVTEFTYELPAITTFDRFAVPDVREVPSPRQTFTRYVEVLGSSVGPDDGFVRLASATLETHQARNQVTELGDPRHATGPLGATAFAGWNRDWGRKDELRLQRDYRERHTGAAAARGLLHWRVGLPLRQDGAGADGPLVSGCYDSLGLLEGTVQGNILKARGVDQGGAKTVSLFVLSVLADNTLTGVRSTNGGPFRLYTGGSVPDVPTLDCLQPPAPLQCGSVIHGIQFGFDSAEIQSDSEPVLAKLYDGLSTDTAASIVIRGHTSSEGSDQYNLELSERRAEAVVGDLVRRGLESGRLSAAGIGEAEPLASNADEAGRSLNRRRNRLRLSRSRSVSTVLCAGNDMTNSAECVGDRAGALA